MAKYLPNEAELVSAAQAGDREAFDTLMSSCYQPTLRLAVGIVRNREDAEDVLQEAMVKAYFNLKQFQRNSRFYTWIVRIAINEALICESDSGGRARGWREAGEARRGKLGAGVGVC